MGEMHVTHIFDVRAPKEELLAGKDFLPVSYLFNMLQLWYAEPGQQLSTYPNEAVERHSL